MILLNDLPKEHHLRNLPLGEIKAKYKWKGASDASPWRTVQRGAPKLVNFTFNELGPSWTEYDLWGVE